MASANHEPVQAMVATISEDVRSSPINKEQTLTFLQLVSLELDASVDTEATTGKTSDVVSGVRTMHREKADP